MSRLTTKYMQSSNYFADECPEDATEIEVERYHYAIVQKLGELEDLEDGFGFTFKELLGIEKVWFKWENGDFQRVYIYGVDIKRKLLLGKMNKRLMTLRLEDHKKTWALNKDQLL